MLFKLNPSAGQPLYQQLMVQICNAIDSGSLKHGDLLPGIRSLAEELVVSHNTVAKAYSELEHEGVLELRHGAGAFVAMKQGTRSSHERVRRAQERVRRLVDSLRENGLSDEEIHRMFVASLFYTERAER
jgi:GntR family transcriptional regulator